MEENNYIEVENDNGTPDPAHVKPFKTGLILGLIGFVASSLNEVLVNLIGSAGAILSVLNVVIFVLAMVLAVRRHRDVELGGFISVGRAIGTAMIAAGVMIIATNVMFVVKASSDEYKQTMEQQFEKQAAQMEANGSTDEEIEQVMKYSKMFTQPKAVVIFMTVVGGILSVIVALIIAYSMKRIPEY